MAKKKIEELEEKIAALEGEKATLESEKATLEGEKADLEDKNLRMMAEFDNYRRRTNKEKLELMETAGEKIFTEMLPLIDDFERAIDAIDDEGVKLIYQKFLSFLWSGTFSAPCPTPSRQRTPISIPTSTKRSLPSLPVRRRKAK